MEVIIMIELFLSSDGKHTVHIAADSPEEFKALTPHAKAYYEAIVEHYGNKAQMWQGAVSVKPNGKSEPKMGKKTDTPEQTTETVAPQCPMHHQPMAFRQGRFGAFWSCKVRKPDGRWCQVTQDADDSGKPTPAGA